MADKVESVKLKHDDVIDTVWEFYKSGGWTDEKNSSDGITIHSKKGPHRRLIMAKVPLKVSPAKVIAEMGPEKVADVPKWNSTLKSAEVIETIDSNTFIFYQITTEGGGGLVSSRDFVNATYRGLRQETHVTAYVSVEHESKPPQNKLVRAENGPSGFLVSPVEGDPNQSEFAWIMNTDFKLPMAPDAIVNQIYMYIMTEYCKALRKHVEE